MNSKQLTMFGVLTVLWGASFLWINIAVQEVGPLMLATFRLFFGLCTLFFMVAIEKPKFSIGKKTWISFIYLGLLQMVIPWTLIFWAQQYIESTIAAVLDSMVPLFTILFAHIFLSDDRMTPNRIAGVILGFIGVLVLIHQDLIQLILTGNLISEHNLMGQIAVLLATVSYGGGNVYARAKFRNVTHLPQAFFPTLFAFLIMLSIMPFAESSFILPMRTGTWVAIVWLGILGAGVAWKMFYVLLHDIGPTRASMVAYTIPIVGVTLGVVFLHESLGWSLLGGTLIIISGVWLANKPVNKNLKMKYTELT